MSAFQFYKTLGDRTPGKPQHQEILAGGSNITIWTPAASMRVVVTNLNISTNLGGTIRFFFGGAEQYKLAEFFMGGSSTLTPSISAWESTAKDAPLYAVVSASTSNAGWKISAEGFELD